MTLIGHHDVAFKFLENGLYCQTSTGSLLISWTVRYLCDGVVGEKSKTFNDFSYLDFAGLCMLCVHIFKFR